MSSTRDYLSYHDAVKLARSQNFNTVRKFWEWSRSADRSKTFPSNPHKVYNEFTSYVDFLGLPNNSPWAKYGKFMSFDDARYFVQFKKFKSRTEYRDYVKNDSNNVRQDLPHNPERIYKDNGWVSWDHFTAYKGRSTKYPVKEYMLFDKDHYVHPPPPKRPRK